MEVFDSGLEIFDERRSVPITFLDDISLLLGTSSDIAIRLHSAVLNANTALAGVLIGTPVTPALAANSLIISNVTADGDILIAANDGGHSRTALFFDASTPDTYLYNVGGTWTAGATTWTIPAVTLGGDVTGGNYNLSSIGNIGLGNTAVSTTALLFSNAKTYVLTDDASIHGIFINSLYGYKTSAAYTGTLYGSLFRVSIPATNTQNWTAALGLIGYHAVLHTYNPGAGAPYTVTGAAAFSAEAPNFQSYTTFTTYYGLIIAANANARIATNYGIYIGDQTGGTTADYGVAIAGADTAALWLGSGADNTDAANGIMFGSSKDTNLYRSAANTLKTDDAFSAASFSVGATAGTDESGSGTITTFTCTIVKGIVTAFAKVS
uniref:Uncharacterized protein n=1 Tax=viral metagenome TaxID=1070528 RepID=A0A6M3JLY5_9ZZZZ